MGKNKLKRWDELETFERVFQPSLGLETTANTLKGNWHRQVFQNNNPVVLELGCGRGEYTVTLAERYPDKNFIGIDIKGARLWRGAKTGHEQQMRHVAFLRTQVDLIEYFFTENEVSEIWLTFPDPQIRDSREFRRLTSPDFLNRYRYVLQNGGVLHLKTDSSTLYTYTLEMLKHERGALKYASANVYTEAPCPKDMDIQTTYEKMFVDKGKTIKYLRFVFEK